MSLDFSIAPYCNGRNCANQLTSYTEYNNGLCDLCMYETEKHHDNEREERKIKEE
jgi:hypothetical protein